MFKYPKKITYALPEQIGNYDLFVGRKKEFDYYLGDWYDTLIRNAALSQAIIARRKKGKTAFMQRYFNILWSDYKTNGDINVIPFYYSIQDAKIPLAEFSKSFFAAFISQYISFMERKREFLDKSISFEKLTDYIKDKDIIEIYESIEGFEKKGNWYLMWETASKAPAEIATRKKVKIVQIIDEFQNIDNYIIDQRGNVIDTMNGTYRQLSEKRQAPLMISGSEIHGLRKILNNLTARFSEYTLENLPEDEAKEAVKRYADFMHIKINEEAKEKIWQLTQGDPLYIKSLFFSRHNTIKDYTNEDNIIEVYQKEINPGGEIFKTWDEYMDKIFGEVNETNSKRIMLYLFQKGEERTRKQISDDLKLQMNDGELQKKLSALISADLISYGRTRFDYKITRDKTYELVFRGIYQKEIDNFVPDIAKELRKEMGKKNQIMGKFGEFTVKEMLKKPFNLEKISENGKKMKIIPENIIERHKIRLGVKEYEIDLIIEGNHQVWIDIKNTKNKYGKREAARWLKIKTAKEKEDKKIIYMTYSLNGYTKEAKEELEKNDVLIMKKCRVE